MLGRNLNTVASRMSTAPKRPKVVAQVPGSASCPSGTFNQSADECTLLEVLQVAPEGYGPTICNVFDLRGIRPDPLPSECGDSAGRFCYAECDRSGALDFWDFLCFQNAFAAGNWYADCDGDGHLTFFDLLCFENEFVAGCP